MLNPRLFTQHKAVPELAQIPGNSAVHLGTFQPLDKPSFNHQLQQWRCRTGGQSSWARGINWASPSLLRSCTSRWAQPQVMSEGSQDLPIHLAIQQLGQNLPNLPDLPQGRNKYTGTPVCSSLSAPMPLYCHAGLRVRNNQPNKKIKQSQTLPIHKRTMPYNLIHKIRSVITPASFTV